jgi:hypothetical protein
LVPKELSDGDTNSVLGEGIGTKENMLGTFVIIVAFMMINGALAMIPALARQYAAASTGGMIDLFTDRGGLGLNQTGGFFHAYELVVLYALVTYNDCPVVNNLVSFEVNGAADPGEGVTIIQVVFTNESGIAEVSFRIPAPLGNPEAIVDGKWNVVATTKLGQETLSDTLTFFIIIPGDVNHDGKVDIRDLALLASAYESRPADPNWNPDADFDNDQYVGLTDLDILVLHYGQHYP